MALIHSFEKSGNFLFKHRGEIPVILFAIALPFVYITPPVLTLWKYVLLCVVAIIVSLLGIAVRAYTIGTTPHGTSGRNTDKQFATRVNTTGIYSIVRHPLYLGNYLMWAGLLIFTGSLAIFLVVSLLYWLYYERIMFAEERYLEGKFGDDYLNWSKEVPAFIPNFKKFQKSDFPFSIKTVLRREYSGLFAITLGFVIVDYLRALAISYHWFRPFTFDWELGDWFRPSFFVLVAIFLIMMTLRTLKHHSHHLDAEENRD